MGNESEVTDDASLRIVSHMWLRGRGTDPMALGLLKVQRVTYKLIANRLLYAKGYSALPE
jgi:hypothetical protein